MPTRRRTIGDNPLDSISVPNRPKARRTKPTTDVPAAVAPTAAASETAQKRTALPVRQDPVQMHASAEPSADPFGNGYELLHRGRIRLVGGDFPPGNTVLTLPQSGGGPGFRLTDDSFVALKRDVVDLTVQSGETTHRTRDLFLWATAGAFIFGPLGALAGSLYGGRERALQLIELRLHDGRNILAVASEPTVRDMQAELR
ncbi:MAG TPA: hypothetical protein VGL83_17470 [Stellaceae bacterium]|jgi:hypothetical protein